MDEQTTETDEPTGMVMSALWSCGTTEIGFTLDAEHNPYSPFYLAMGPDPKVVLNDTTPDAIFEALAERPMPPEDLNLCLRRLEELRTIYNRTVAYFIAQNEDESDEDE